jgi:uncharacterized 2Fe-2S/4Fe-4S cluster protein (DUF4445 family)
LNTLKHFIMTWALSVLAASAVGATWLYIHPQQKLARVDMKILFINQKAAFDSLVKPDMTEPELKAVVAAAKTYALRLNQSLETVSNECNCALLNSDAIIDLPKDVNAAGIPDLTSRVQQLITATK